jgi:hypothetical protein
MYVAPAGVHLLAETLAKLVSYEQEPCTWPDSAHCSKFGTEFFKRGVPLDQDFGRPSRPNFVFGDPFEPGVLLWGPFWALFLHLGAEGCQQQLKYASQLAGLKLGRNAAGVPEAAKRR